MTMTGAGGGRGRGRGRGRGAGGAATPGRGRGAGGAATPRRPGEGAAAPGPWGAPPQTIRLNTVHWQFMDGPGLGPGSSEFGVDTTPQRRVYQYHVEFDPEEDREPVRKSLLRVHKKTLGGYLYDGAELYTVARLQSEPFAPLELYSNRREDGQRIKILIKFTCIVAPAYYHDIIRKCSEALARQRAGRDVVDPDA